MKKDNKPDQLAIDAAAARAAGLSYGKWRAMQPQRPPAQTAPKSKQECYIKRYCAECGGEFTVSAPKSRKRYCCEACKQRVYDRAKREKAKAAK